MTSGWADSAFQIRNKTLSRTPLPFFSNRRCNRIPRPPAGVQRNGASPHHNRKISTRWDYLVPSLRGHTRARLRRTAPEGWQWGRRIHILGLIPAAVRVLSAISGESHTYRLCRYIVFYNNNSRSSAPLPPTLTRVRAAHERPRINLGSTRKNTPTTVLESQDIARWMSRDTAQASVPYCPGAGGGRLTIAPCPTTGNETPLAGALCRTVMYDAGQQGRLPE